MKDHNLVAGGTGMQQTNDSDSGADGEAGAAATEARGRWNPYGVGAGLGVLSWMAFAVLDKPLGISTALSSLSGGCALPVMGSEGVAANAYWAKHPLAWDGGMLFLLATFFGGLVSVGACRGFRWEKVPAVWAARFGPVPARRWLVSFLGGVIIMFGARMAGGCTSGHGISGTLQLAVSSWVFFLTMFAAGVVTAWLLWRRSGSGTGTP